MQSMTGPPATAENVTDTQCASTTPTANYNANNQVTWAQYVAPAGFTYDAAGNVRSDGVNEYSYDYENRICTVSTTVSGTTSITGYLYDASGLRVAKGPVSSATICPASGSTTSPLNSPNSQYLLDLAGNQVTELNSA
ncbi:MAG: hypothetical protein ABR923_17155, partial [Terracidiphilus sp.]